MQTEGDIAQGLISRIASLRKLNLSCGAWDILVAIVEYFQIKHDMIIASTKMLEI